MSGNGSHSHRPPTYKQEVIASRGVVASNHPMASAAGVEMLVRGGNAVDAAVATLFALTVVEPMMVTPFGAGFFLIRDGRTGEVAAIDNYATVPAAATSDMFEPMPDSLDYETVGKANDVGYLAVATGGNLKGWAYASARHGRLPFAHLIQPAIRYATEGFAAGGYLIQHIEKYQDDIRRFPATAEVFLPDGRVPSVGQTIVRADYARTLQQIADEGPETMYTGSLARRIVEDMAANGGLISMDDLAGYRLFERTPVRGDYRGHEVVSMAPVSSGGTHIVQLLNLLEPFAVGRGDLTFGTPGYIHLFAEALKITFADRRRYMADPERVPVPVEWLISRAYADQRRPEIDRTRAKDHTHGELVGVSGATPPLGGGWGTARVPQMNNLAFAGGEGANTTHLTVIDDEGTIVSATQTAQSGFGAKVTVPGTGMILNNCMLLMDPTPGRTNSIDGGKRILSSMSPTIVLKDGAPFMALGTPGGKRIFAAVAQAILNVIDHGMTLQEAVEAPRVWTQGADLELEEVFPNLPELEFALQTLGHRTTVVPKVAGGMNGVLVDDRGLLHGAACWRADGVPIGISGGPARPSASTGIPD
jgi:gamma-glutamyltranspeptidase/glutathione hydrolase